MESNVKSRRNEKAEKADKTCDLDMERIEKAIKNPDISKKDREKLRDGFPAIRSTSDIHSSFESIRRRMKVAAKLSGSWRGSVGFIEVYIPDLLDRGCSVYGRNFILPECSIGVHDVAQPNYRDRDGNPLTSKQREEIKRKCRRLVGCNYNGSGTAKAMMAARCLAMGIRCILTTGGCAIVDNWPDRDEIAKKFNENNCSYSIS